MSIYLSFVFGALLGTTILMLLRLAIVDYPRKIVIERWVDVVDLIVRIGLTVWTGVLFFGGAS